MAVSDFDMLLEELGFEAAGIAQQVGLTERKRNLALDMLGLSGEEQRRNLSEGFESRGFLRSGEHQRALALQRADEANRAAQIDTAAADDLSRLDLMAASALQSELGNDRLSDAQHAATMDDLAYALSLTQSNPADDDVFTSAMFPSGAWGSSTQPDTPTESTPRKPRLASPPPRSGEPSYDLDLGF